jgi:hypothetical protein
MAARGGRKTSIGGQFAPRLIEMLESPASRVLSRAAEQVLKRIEIELGHHGGNDNGKLPVTFDHFEEYGIHRHSIGPAIREVVALGFVEITRAGRAGNGEFRLPTLFRLTYRPTDKHGATDEWRNVATIEDAKRIADAARAEKQKTSGGKRQITVRKPHHNRAIASGGNRTTSSSAETVTTSISRGHSASVDGRAGTRRPTKQASVPGPISEAPEPVGIISSTLPHSKIVAGAKNGGRG